MSSSSLVGRVFTAFGRGIAVRRRPRTMHLCETLPLGERRFLAVVMVERQKFLVGTAGNSIALLARLPSNGDDELGVTEGV